jgi:hypothetical protein
VNPCHTKWHVLGLRMENTAYRYGEQPRKYSISSYGQPIRGSPPAWGLSMMVKAPHRRRSTWDL